MAANLLAASLVRLSRRLKDGELNTASTSARCVFDRDTFGVFNSSELSYSAEVDNTHALHDVLFVCLNLVHSLSSMFAAHV